MSGREKEKKEKKHFRTLILTAFMHGRGAPRTEHFIGATLIRE